jgi:hypothetical protein
MEAKSTEKLSAKMSQFGRRLRVDRPTRGVIFRSLQTEACNTLNHMGISDQRNFSAFWCLAARFWLRREALTSVSSISENQNSLNHNNCHPILP